MGPWCKGLLVALALGPGPDAPRDPNEVPYMRSPGGQPQPDSRVRDIDASRGFSNRRRLQLSLMPTYAGFRVPFIGRPTNRVVHGGGAALEFDVELYQPFWLRLVASHTAHPVATIFFPPDDPDDPEGADPAVRAPGGVINATHAGLGLAYAMDLGRVVPTIDVGVGAMLLLSPPGPNDGQRGAPCAAGGVCDFGLVCAPDETCQPGIQATIHGGLSVDVFVHHRWTVGAAIRYFALLTAPGDFPLYVQAALRFGVRF